jgi:hypothetical protein
MSRDLSLVPPIVREIIALTESSKGYVVEFYTDLIRQKGLSLRIAAPHTLIVPLSVAVYCRVQCGRAAAPTSTPTDHRLIELSFIDRIISLHLIFRMCSTTPTTTTTTNNNTTTQIYQPVVAQINTDKAPGTTNQRQT